MFYTQKSQLNPLNYIFRLSFSWQFRKEKKGIFNNSVVNNDMNSLLKSGKQIIILHAEPIQSLLMSVI